MSDFTNYLINTYKHLVKPGRKEVSEILEELSSNLSFDKAKRIPITEYHLSSIISNLIQHLNCFGITVTKDQLNIEIYIVAHDSKSHEYYKEIMELSEELLFIICEKQYEYLDSNSNTLQRKLWMMQGVSLSDYEQNSLKLIEYLTILDRYYNES